MASGNNSVALCTNSIADQANTVSVGSPGNERRITNVAPGINPTDAVNLSQLQSVQGNVNDVARRSYSGIAAATALAMIPEVDPGKTLSVGFGSGNYQGYSAVAFGFTARVAENIKVKGAAAAARALCSGWVPRTSGSARLYWRASNGLFDARLVHAANWHDFTSHTYVKHPPKQLRSTDCA